MKKHWLLLPILFLSLMLYSCDETPYEETVEPKYTFLVGAYTGAEDQGIQLLSLNPDELTLETKVIANVNNPSFVIANKARDMVFSVDETTGEQGGRIKSFGFNPQTGEMKLISTVDSYGDHPCYLSLSPSEDFLVAGNYTGGSFSVFSIKEGVLEHVQTIQHEGSSIIPSRQEKPHVHSAVFHPNSEQLLIGDLGTDKIYIYDFNPEYAVPFSPADPAYFEVEPGSGPRHLTIHPDGSQIYLVHELTANLGVYNYDNGNISQSQILPLTEKSFIGNVGAAEVRISNDGNYVYASNRGDANEISVFEIGKDKKLNFVQRISTGGSTPRNFILSPDGNFLLVANQGSNEIRLFKRDSKTGKLSQTDITVPVHKPAYLFALQ